MYKKHYIKHPEVATDKDIEIIEKQLEMMLNMVGWMFGDYVALFKEKQDGKVTAFFAWECVKQ